MCAHKQLEVASLQSFEIAGLLRLSVSQVRVRIALTIVTQKMAQNRTSFGRTQPAFKISKLSAILLSRLGMVGLCAVQSLMVTPE